eukprot:Em0015g1133a
MYVRVRSSRLGGFDLDAHDFHEKMELCDVCGSFLVIGDVQLRVDAHLLGKTALGFCTHQSHHCRTQELSPEPESAVLLIDAC